MNSHAVVSRIFKPTCNTLKIFTRNYTPRRAFLYVPASDERKLKKAFNIDVDCIVMDCEDGVALNMKDVARKSILAQLNKGKPVKNRAYDLAVRCNSIDSNLCEEDLRVILNGKYLPDTIALPKVENSDHLKWFSDQLKKNILSLEKKVNLIIFIESARAMINLEEILETMLEMSKDEKFNPVGVVFGSDDFCASIGAIRTDDAKEILYARQKLVMCAKAFNLQAIDMVYIKYKDLIGLKQQCIEGANMGYTGKQVIHPDQIPIVQEAFLPQPNQIEWAKNLLAAFEDHQQSGKGAFIFGGSMIDMPTMKQAQNILNVVKNLPK